MRRSSGLHIKSLEGIQHLAVLLGLSPRSPTPASHASVQRQAAGFTTILGLVVAFASPVLRGVLTWKVGSMDRTPCFVISGLGVERGEEGAQYILTSRPSEPCGFSFHTVRALD